MIKEGDILFDCYPTEGIYSVFLVKAKADSYDRYGTWVCDLMQVYLDKELVTARSDIMFTERYLGTLSPEAY